MTSILLLGSTGSIGTQTLDLVRQSGSGLSVSGLAARTSWETLLEQAHEFGVTQLALTDTEAAASARPHLAPGTHLHEGPEALQELIHACEFDTAVHGVVGCAGLPASVDILRRGKRLALANKESLVVAGRHLMALAEEHGAEIIPVDSEHSAVLQCLRGEDRARLKRVLLTCSGGPLRLTPSADLDRVTPQEALQHPNWSMGPRITIGSASLMNKALEVIELHHLFELTPEQIEVVIHPQSIVHSMVEFVDGAVVAHMGVPDMRGPIHHALHSPDRPPSPVRGFDLKAFAKLEFEAPDPVRFPALTLGYECIRAGEDAACVLNAADEVAVQAFLDGAISFTDMNRVHHAALEKRQGDASSIEALMAADLRARTHAQEAVQTLTASGPAAPKTASSP
ncbi:MAG TPA: 1-deoxy-D-xylulose-5-phosphate reductoisomerase [Planctomycetes bacterium]|nr:1-deoxy-D-xylulose-5-phosphate reductoisomerase [Planctomycetota bacterium]HIK62215.1 1-deoxy-D-xylulose-5-phosphate reductoisomerase [Planctomycetota bacterium]